MHYYHFLKPGIIYGNALTAAAGFFFASHGIVDWQLFAAMLAGLSLSIASACAFNNVIDRGIDAKMERTKNRAIPAGKISPREGLIIATILGVCGFLLIAFYTTVVAFAVLLFGYGMYLLVYSYLKRGNTYFTYAGALAGAVPPVVGYAAVTGSLDASAYALFLILCLWQMAHFYAIAIYRKDEYASAGIPVYPITKGTLRTQIELHFFVLAFVVSTLLLPFLHEVSVAYLPIMTVVGIVWLFVALRGIRASDENVWARQTFLFSLLVIVLFSVAISL